MKFNDITVLSESLSKSDPIEKWISDFVDSSDSRFTGKSKEERIKMAKGAYYGAQKADDALETEATEMKSENFAKSVAAQEKLAQAATARGDHATAQKHRNAIARMKKKVATNESTNTVAYHEQQMEKHHNAAQAAKKAGDNMHQ